MWGIYFSLSSDAAEYWNIAYDTLMKMIISLVVNGTCYNDIRYVKLVLISSLLFLLKKNRSEFYEPKDFYQLKAYKLLVTEVSEFLLPIITDNNEENAIKYVFLKKYQVLIIFSDKHCPILPQTSCLKIKPSLWI